MSYETRKDGRLCRRLIEHSHLTKEIVMPYIRDCLDARRPARSANEVIRIWVLALTAVFAFLFLGSALAADNKKSTAKSNAASSSYQEERAACMKMTDKQDRTTCLREVGAARQDAKRGKLADTDADFQRNALKRCESMAAADRQACEMRVRGEGNTSGSVQGGGILRQATTTEPVQTPATGSQPASRPVPAQPMPSGTVQPRPMQPGSGTTGSTMR